MSPDNPTTGLNDDKNIVRGYGKVAMEMLIEWIKEDIQDRVIYISFEPENIWAKHLYVKLGFKAAAALDFNSKTAAVASSVTWVSNLNLWVLRLV